MVPQQSNLDRSLRVREILTFHAAYHGVPHREREQRADALLDELGLGDRKDDRVARYSGGMSQRLMIARALMHAPDVLFLDEPTNNLDPQSRLFLWDRIRALNAQGLTILLTTHDMNEADQLCGRIAIMDKGRILVNDTSAELKKLIPGGNAVRSARAACRRPDAGAARAGRAARAAGRHQSGRTGRRRTRPGPTKKWGWSRTASMPKRRPRWSGPATQAVLLAGAQVRDLHVKQPSLEDVFIYLTGRHLR